MIVLAKNNIPTRDMPTMSRDELESEWHKAQEYFYEVRAQKIETDRLYIAAANQLNTVERLMKKVERQEAFSKR
jgi:hypothetical protein